MIVPMPSRPTNGVGFRLTVADEAEVAAEATGISVTGATLGATEGAKPGSTVGVSGDNCINIHNPSLSPLSAPMPKEIE
jgi:hypothetical protein